MICTEQKMKFSIKDFFSKCDQISRKLRIWSYLLKKSLMGNFIFCAVMNDIYKNIEEYNPNKKRKILIAFDEMIADMASNKNIIQW